MSFNPFAPEGAIITRLKSDVTLVSTTQGIYNTVAIDGDGSDIMIGVGKQPFVVLTHVSGTFGNSTFRTNIASSVYQVSVFDHKGNGAVPAQTVAGRVFGNSEGTDNTPTFGLARWKMTGVADMADITVVPESYGTLHDAEALHYWMQFSIENVEA